MAVGLRSHGHFFCPWQNTLFGKNVHNFATLI